MWKTIYQAPTSHHWSGRADALPKSTFYQVIHCNDMRVMTPSKETALTFALIGFSCDAGVKRNMGRLGAANGPDAIRQVLGSLPIKRSGITLYDVGNIVCQDDELEVAQHALSDVVALLLAAGIIPIVLGGGHELAWGHYQGLVKNQSIHSLGIINFDAHYDMRPLLHETRGSSGTPFLQIANDRKNKNQVFDYTCVGVQALGNSSQLDEIAKQHLVQTIYADHLHEFGVITACQLLHDVIDRCQSIYVSLCLDVYAAPFAPGVSAPQVLGLMPWQVQTMLRELAQSKKIISYDIAEYCPAFDIDSRTAKLAASLIYQIIHHHIS